MTEEFVSLKGEIGARRCHCCRGRMAKGTSPAARKPTSPPGAGSTTRAPWRHSPGPGGVSRRNTLAAEDSELRRRLTRSETELEKARRAPRPPPSTAAAGRRGRRPSSREGCPEEHSRQVSARWSSPSCAASASWTPPWPQSGPRSWTWASTSVPSAPCTGSCRATARCGSAATSCGARL